MQANTDPSELNRNETPGVRPSPTLVPFLEEETRKLEEFRANLQNGYDATTYEEFEKRFNDLRMTFKQKAKDFSDPDNEFLNSTELRRKTMQEILDCATVVAQRFQEARENNRLDRPRCTSALEDLTYAIKNLGTLVKEQGKI